MDKTREEDDLPSPKRQTLGQVSQSGMSTARAVAELDDAIWTSIVEFMPIPKDLEVGDQKKHDAAVSEVATTWRTLLHLRLVSKKLAALLHPHENAALWRRLVLQSFDFSTHYGFNVENYQDDIGLDVPSDEEESEEDEEDEDEEEEEEEEEADEETEVVTEEPAEASTGSEEKTEDKTEGKTEEKSDEKTAEKTVEKTNENPQLEAMRGRYHDMPSEYLEEDLVSWGTLGIYHRPSQYGFLTTLQQQSPEGEWPESEDPFTLFGDLVHLLQLPHGDGMMDHGEAGDSMFKYLAAPAEADSSSPFHRFYVMKTLGYVPHFWHWGTGIGAEWKGFTESDRFEKAVGQHKGVHADGEEDDNCDEDDSFDEDTDYGFPSCSVGDAKRLYRHIRQHCRDWRSVCCNSNSDGFTPVFSVGESKAAPHRWTGYGGKKCWT